MVCAPEERAELERIFRRTGEINDYAILLRAKDGREVACAIAMKHFVDAEDGVERIVGSLRDITERKRLEAQLLQAQKMESIGQLAGGIAHDFNNLLTAIIGYTQLALETLPPDAQAQPDLDEILKAAERATNLTHRCWRSPANRSSRCRCSSSTT